ncbi:MAG: RNA 2',3'-cyclic phosphodiesterase [Acidobacteria bacterium]|nr:RNA 2',3'-cyclic phosphodiesterase [Acidobacteriota bacterium]
MDGKRLFLAVPLTDMARNFLVDIQEKLLPVFGRRGRTRPESMHLTVKFLGSVNNDRITGLKGVVRESVQSIPPFHLKLDQLTAFGKSNAPRIVAASLTPIDSIRFLAERVDQACASLGFQMEKRPFSPHITIYRPKKPGKPGKIQLDSVIQIPVQELILFQSELKPDGAVYHVLEIFPLSGNGGKENGDAR